MNAISRRLSLSLIILPCTFAQAAVAAGNPVAGTLARNAFFAIENKPFDREVTGKAAEDIARAYKQDPKHPWVSIAISRLHLEQGYLKGDRTKLSSYLAESIEKASRHARQAVELGANESMAHVQVARIQIISENYKGAWETLNQAHKLDMAGFDPWYFRSVISIKMNDPKRAGDALDEAEKRSTLPYQKRWVTQNRIHLARLNKDAVAEEKYYKTAIEQEKEEPHPYGNYATFLKRHKRYDEAITYYQKALAISPYPLAEEQLRQTKLLKDGAAK